MDPAEFEIARGLTQESSVIISGVVRADERAPGFPGGYEIGINKLELVQQSAEYPITPKEHGTEFLMNHRHLWVRSNRQWAILRIRATIIKALRDWLDDQGFLLVDTPIITPAAGEETTTLFEVDYFGESAFFGADRATLQRSQHHGIWQGLLLWTNFSRRKIKDAAAPDRVLDAGAGDRVLQFGRTDGHRRRHGVLCGGASLGETSAGTGDHRGAISTSLEAISAPFARISYDEAVEKLQALQQQIDDPASREEIAIEWGEDFGSPQETALAEMFDKPVFVYHYPTAVKAFYMTPVAGRPEICRSVDLLAPEGYGEIIGGSERIHDLELLARNIDEMGLGREAYEWYLDLRKFGTVPHAGFGIGIERTVAWICGLNHVRETIPYARLLNRKYP